MCPSPPVDTLDEQPPVADGLRARLGPIADPLALLESLFAHTPVPYAIFDAAGYTLAMNPAHQAMFGRPAPREYNVLHDPISEQMGLAGIVRRAFAGEAVQTPPIWYDPKDLKGFDTAGAKRVAMACHFFPLFDGNGVLTHVAIAYVDMTADLEARGRAATELARLTALADEKDRLANALRESEERLRTTIEAAEVGTWDWNIVENSVHWSSNVERIFGLEPGEFAGTYEAWLALVHPADRQMMTDKVAATLNARAPYEAEHRVVRPDGSIGWKSTRGHVVYDDAGQPKALRGIVFDVSARRAAEDALKMPAQVLENMTEGVNLTTEDGIILYTNPAEDRMFGYARGELLGKHVTVLNDYPPEENERIVSEVIAQLRLKREWIGEWSNQRKDGTPFTSRSRITVLELDGKPYWLCVQEDVTDEVAGRKRADDLAESLRASERQLRLITNALPALVTYIDPEQRFRFANDAYMSWLGVDPASLIGEHARVLVGDIGYSQIKPYMERALAGELVQYEREVTLADGRTIYAQMNYVPDKDEHGRTQGYVALIHDLTDRRRAELQEVEAREQAEAGNRAKDEFLALLGHELRNPLSPILTALELIKLRDEGAFASEREVIERQVKHVVRLVDDLLDVSRITRGKVSLERRQIDLVDVIESAIELTSPLLEQHTHRLTVRVPRGLVVDGDPLRLAQVFANLLSNAAKYTPRAGEITIEGEVIGGRARVSVRDTGIGIRPEMLPRVFDQFVQEPQALDRSQGGLGLGLSIVRSLVELHGGQVEVSSKGVGRGSEFSVYLKVAAEPSAPAEGRSQRSALPRPSGLRVLVVDDNEDAARLLARLLGQWGYSVRVAYDGPTALKIAPEFTPDVALLDIGLPAMDGYELARRLRTLPALSGLRLVAITGYGQERDREAAAQAGFHHHVVKPVDLATLVDVLSRAALG